MKSIQWTGLIFLALLVGIFTFSGCSKSDDQAEKDHQLIQEYVTEHHLNGQFTASGLYYVIQDSGSAVHPNIQSLLNVNYKGYLLDGTVFDQRNGAQFRLSDVIVGWQEGLPLIGVGGKIQLLVPSALGYGSNQVGTIPPNSVLGFDITLNSVSK